MSTFSTLLFATFCVFSNIDWAFSQEHEALAVITNAQTSTNLDLPYSATEQNGQIIYLKKNKDGSKIKYSYLCPPQTSDLVQYLRKESSTRKELKFYLEGNFSNDQPLKCPKEVKPTLKISKGYCGNMIYRDQGMIYKFGFGIAKLKYEEVDPTPSSFKIFPFGGFSRSSPIYHPPNKKLLTGMLNLYNVCIYRWSPKTLWTKHQVKTASMLQELQLPSEKIQPTYKFSEEDYGLPQGTFSKIAEEYKTKQESNSLYKMVLQMMVPEEDLALKLWKKTALHFVNTATLWVDLVPLMKAINDGIRKAIIATSLSKDKSNINQSDTVYIYTSAYSYTYSHKFSDLVKNTDHLSNNRFGLNFWCKFIHNVTKSTGVMIYLHNFPNSPPIEEIDSDASNDSESSESKILLQNTECETLINCDFRNWSYESADLSDNLVNYAYCCKVNEYKVKELFGIQLLSEPGVFDIDRIINNSEEKK